jgi:hypothetical protein
MKKKSDSQEKKVYGETNIFRNIREFFGDYEHFGSVYLYQGISAIERFAFALILSPETEHMGCEA